ncbi:transcriptional regulator [Nitrospira sp. Kam-Ns4a]
MTAEPKETNRQRIMRLIAQTRCSSRDLAERLGLPERRVEDDLAHVARTVAGDRDRQFVVEPAECLACGFVFRTRTRLTRPGHCPHCRSEHISRPRFGIEPRVARQRTRSRP